VGQGIEMRRNAAKIDAVSPLKAKYWRRIEAGEPLYERTSSGQLVLQRTEIERWELLYWNTSAGCMN